MLIVSVLYYIVSINTMARKKGTTHIRMNRMKYDSHMECTQIVRAQLSKFAYSVYLHFAYCDDKQRPVIREFQGEKSGGRGCVRGG